MRQIEQRLPQLTFDAGRAVAVFQVLGGQRFSQSLGVDVEAKDRLKPRRRSARVALGKRAELDQQRGVNGERIAGGKGRKPAFRGLGGCQRVLRGLAETKHSDEAWARGYDICTAPIVVGS